ncbi:MAG: Flp family type IVb pilin [Candidatus Omnitrophica bacterium]|nr:Flp family type IVb pilin [Candidatus Omnitrophota bacterium]
MLKQLRKKENGQAATEYGLLLALLSIAVIVVLTTLGPHIARTFQQVDNTIASISGTS